MELFLFRKMSLEPKTFFSPINEQKCMGGLPLTPTSKGNIWLTREDGAKLREVTESDRVCQGEDISV